MARYGTDTATKEVLAREGSLPGAPVDPSADQEIADRYAAGFLFGLQYPTLAENVLPYLNMLKTSDIPGFGGSSPELQSYGSHGIQQGILEATKGTTLKDLVK